MRGFKLGKRRKGAPRGQEISYSEGTYSKLSEHDAGRGQYGTEMVHRLIRTHKGKSTLTHRANLEAAFDDKPMHLN